MKQQRLEQLADGIFSIVMTLLVIDIKVPALEVFTEAGLWSALLGNMSLYLSYLLSFVMIFTYWRSHHFVTSVFAKSVDNHLVNINAVFFFFVALVPFTSHLLGEYSQSTTAVIIFALHTILIGITLFWMRYYSEKSASIVNEEITPSENRHAYARILFPVFAATMALIFAPFGTQLALFIFTIGLFLNYARHSTRYVFAVIGIFYPKWRE